MVGEVMIDYVWLLIIMNEINMDVYGKKGWC